MAHLTIEQRHRGEVAILDLEGRLTLGDASVTLRERIRSLLSAGHKQILINMRGVGYMDSSGLGDLISAFATARKQDATLKLVNLREGVKSILHITKLLTVFETFESEEEAVRSFEPARAASGSI